MPDLMFQINQDGTALALHEDKFAIPQNFVREIIGKDIYLISDGRRLLPKRMLDRAMAY